eukprot:jgi/Botrbrau1/8647/Bobra.0087s0002.1
MSTASTSKATEAALAAAVSGKDAAGPSKSQNEASRVQGPSPPPKPELGWTPLHLAAYNNRPDDVTVLLKDPKTLVNAQAEAPIPSATGKTANVKGLTPLHLAAAAGATAALKALLAHKAPTERTGALDVNARSGNGMTPLHLAVVAGKPDAVRLLLGDSRTDPAASDTEGNTSLLYAAKAPGPIVAMLLADPRVTPDVVNARNRHGFGAVHVAAEAANLGNPAPLQALTRCPTTNLRLESRGPTKYTPQDILQRSASLRGPPPSGVVPPGTPRPSIPPPGPISPIHILVVHPIVSIILIIAVSGFADALSDRLFWTLLLMISLDICWIAAQAPTIEELQRRAALAGYADRVWGAVHSGTSCLLVRAGVGVIVVTLAWMEAPVGSPMWAAITMIATFALAIDIPLLLELHERSLRYGNLLDTVLPRDVQQLVWGLEPRSPASAPGVAPASSDTTLPPAPKEAPTEAGPGGTGGTAAPPASSSAEAPAASSGPEVAAAGPPGPASQTAAPAAESAEQPPSWREKLLDALVPSEELRVAFDFMLCQLVALLFTGDIFMLGFSLQAVFLGAISSGAVWLTLYRLVFPPGSGGPPPGPAPPPGGGSRWRTGISIAWKDREFWTEMFQSKSSLWGWREVAAVSVELTRPVGYSCVIYISFSLLLSGSCPSKMAWWAQPLFFLVVALDVCLNLMAVHQQKCSGTAELRGAIFATRTIATAAMATITILLIVFQGLGWLWDLRHTPPCPPHLVCLNGCPHIAGLLIVFFTISLVQSGLLWGPLRLLALGWGMVVACISFVVGFFVGSVVWGVCVLVKAVALPFQKRQPLSAAQEPTADTIV